MHQRTRCPFSKEEDMILERLVHQFGENDWAKIASFMRPRSVRQCRERWMNSLSPEILKKKWTNAEDELLIRKYNAIGPHWKLLENFFHGRTSYSLRNRFKSLSRRNLQKFEYSNSENANQKTQSAGVILKKDNSPYNPPTENSPQFDWDELFFSTFFDQNEEDAMSIDFDNIFRH